MICYVCINYVDKNYDEMKGTNPRRRALAIRMRGILHNAHGDS